MQQKRSEVDRTCRALIVCIGALLLCQCSASGRAMHHDVIAYGAFHDLRIYRPQGPIRHLAVLVSGDGGWGAPLDVVSAGLAARGALVAGIDAREWLTTLNRAGAACIDLGAELSDLAHYLGERYGVAAQTPVLIGHSAGASLAYVALAQSHPAEFAGALTLSFCADLDLARRLCPAAPLQATSRAGGVRLLPGGELPGPWIALHGLDDHECPVLEGREFAKGVPGSRFVALPGVGHSYRDAGRWWGDFVASYDTLAAGAVRSR
jgi:type IV secretory pathway VirJ component